MAAVVGPSRDLNQLAQQLQHWNDVCSNETSFWRNVACLHVCSGDNKNKVGAQRSRAPVLQVPIAARQRGSSRGRVEVGWQ
jgi:hypothetical protein